MYHDFWISQNLQLLAILDLTIVKASWACFKEGKKTVLAGQMNPWDRDNVFVRDSCIGKLG